MKYKRKHFLQLWILSLSFVLQPFYGFAQSKPSEANTISRQTIKERDGQHDFDFNLGSWKTQI
ncbi:MAG: hypothetical protein ACR2LT_05260, partial [Pyrinomonadaceae bacterium]